MNKYLKTQNFKEYCDYNSVHFNYTMPQVDEELNKL